MGAPAATEQAIARALKAAQACGLAIASFSVDPKTGLVTVQTPAAPLGQEKPLDTPAPNVEPLRARQWKKR